MKHYDLIIIGGGAAGFFCAVQAADRRPDFKILILEKSKELLSKVRISGGGRCNVTHACFDPAEMVTYYPRGNKELLGPFHKFLCGDMMAWLAENGVETNIESDGRVFPASNNSESIVNCFIDLCIKNNTEIVTQSGVEKIEKKSDHWLVYTTKEKYTASQILFATGSSPATWKILKSLGHTIIAPVPSLFTFNINEPLINGLAGISVRAAEVSIEKFKIKQIGPLLITHRGLSGPAVLKLSAWAARELFECNYQCEININWINSDPESVAEMLQIIRAEKGKRKLNSRVLFDLPKRLWQNMLSILKLDGLNYAELTAGQINVLSEMLTRCRLRVNGKNTFKDEFVTCGGIDTKEINFKTMESRLFPGLYFAGEVINIDAVTGGFNFQAAWTEAFLAAAAVVRATN